MVVWVGAAHVAGGGLGGMAWHRARLSSLGRFNESVLPPCCDLSASPSIFTSKDNLLLLLLQLSLPPLLSPSPQVPGISPATRPSGAAMRAPAHALRMLKALSSLSLEMLGHDLAPLTCPAPRMCSGRGSGGVVTAKRKAEVDCRGGCRAAVQHVRMRVEARHVAGAML